VTATNHAVTGAIIGLLVADPLIALPTAVLSHFVCDSLPHFGTKLSGEIWLKSKAFRNMLFIDASLCIILVACLAIAHPHHWLLASICAFLATSPDLVWINRYRLLRAKKPWHPSLFSRFAGKIQWFERPIGTVVEVIWFIAGVTILSRYIRF
jgi:hypothetical protein